jgi:hypothetical protein
MAGRKWQGTPLGILIGDGIGIFSALKSRKDTRDQIAGSVQDGINGAIAQRQNRTRRAQQTLDDARERVRDAAEAGALAYRRAKSIAS